MELLNPEPDIVLGEISSNSCFPAPQFHQAQHEESNIFGSTGSIGAYLARAIGKAGFPTTALIRKATIYSKAELVDNLKRANVNIIEGDLADSSLESLTTLPARRGDLCAFR